MKRWAGILFLFLIFNNRAALAQESPGEMLKAARTAYDRADYNTALDLYQQLLKAGVDNAELYYNLGNTEFKAGHIGLAIASYRRALKRAPGDEDIRYNLQYVKNFVRQPPDRSGPLTHWLEEAFNTFSSQTLALGAGVSYLIFSLLIGSLIIRRWQGLGLRWTAGIMGVIFFTMAGWASLRIGIEKNVTWGVVVNSQAEARNGPGPEYQVGFTVPEGRECRILGREGDWRAIGLPAEGYKGWVKASELWEDE